VGCGVIDELYYGRPSLSKLRRELNLVDIPTLEKMYWLRLLDGYVYRLNLELIERYRKGSKRHRVISKEIKDYECFYKAMEVISETEYYNRSVGEL
jgi:hypothetical protein